MPLTAPGQEYRHFRVTKHLPIEELACTLTELEHVPTGAKVMHIGNDDPENLFSLSFQTVPYNSNGVAHILEHTVLCGSDKYPVKDPFFAMTRRSLNTYMNALTGQDFTCYPAATQVSKDFYNLLDVYIDAVFHPKLEKLSFMQEGHRLEFSDPEDPTSPLEYKGIVFNEMKGALSSPASRLAEKLCAALFPDVTYGHNSGGNPADIPALTYEQLLEFHHTHYHPARCLYFFYGNLPIEQHLDFLGERLLDKAERASPLPPVAHQPRFNEPKRIIDHYPIGADEETAGKTMIAFGWLTCNVLDQVELLGLMILEAIIMDTDAAPLKMALLKSGLCKQASAYIDPDIVDAPIIFTLKGCEENAADGLEEVIRTTLKTLADRGIPRHMIDDAMHQMEFHRSEISGDSTPFGLTLFFRSALIKQHGATAEDGLQIHSLFEKIERKVAEDPDYFSNLIRKYLLDNSHFVRLTMLPDKELEKRETEAELLLLKKINERLSATDKQRIVDEAAALAAFQEAQEEEDADVLPTMTIADIPETNQEYPLLQEEFPEALVCHHDCFTNKIAYVELIYDLPALTAEELPLLRLLTTLIPQMGSGGRGYAETLRYIQANTGGIGAGMSQNVQVDDFLQIRPTLHIRGKALYRLCDKLFPLLKDTVESVDFTDIERLREAIVKHFTVLQNSFVNHSLRYAISLSASQLNTPYAISGCWYGLAYYEALREWANGLDNVIEQLSVQLSSLYNKIMRIGKPALVISCDARFYQEMKQQKFWGLLETANRPFSPWKSPIDPQKIENQGRIIASPVAFTAKVLETVPYSHPQAPALALAANLMDNTCLHRSLREQGGAYGGGATCSTSIGQFYFYSYRDPNIVSTLDAFEEAALSVAKGDFTDDQLREAIFEKIQSIDAPVSPGARAEVAYNWLLEGKTAAVRQQFRERLLHTTKADVVEAVNKWILHPAKHPADVVFAGKDLLEKENRALLAKGKAGIEVFA